MPRHQQPLDEIYGIEEHGAEYAQDDDGDEHAWRLKLALSQQDNLAKSGLAGDEFANDGADQTKRDADLHA